MALTIKKQLISSSKYSVKAPHPMDAQYVTVHNTANDASAQNEIDYMVRNSNQTSYHYAVDDKEAIQAIPHNRNAWHAGDSSKGDGNRKSIGVEICYSKSGGEKYKKAENNAAELVARILKEEGLGIDRVKTHKHWTEVGKKKGYSSYVKNCPHRILDNKGWDDFLAKVKKELAELNGGGKVTPPKQEVKGDTVKSDEKDILFRVRKSKDDDKTQKGAFRNIESAKDLADKNAGYKVFDIHGDLVYTPKKAETKKEEPKKAEPAKSSGDNKANPSYPGKLIKKGSKGKDVERIQRAVGVTAGGIFGANTEKAVKAYQKRKGLAADGIVGKNTWNMMF